MKPRHLTRALLRAVGAGLVVASTVMSTTAAFAADPVATSPQQAISLSRKLTGHLDPGTGGHFAFYKFFYPADGSTATINVNFTPDDATVLQNAGLKIYDPAGAQLLDGGRQPKNYPNVSGNVIITDTNRAGVYIVQLYNYDPNAAFDYEIWGTGLAPQPDAGTPPRRPRSPRPRSPRRRSPRRSCPARPSPRPRPCRPGRPPRRPRPRPTTPRRRTRSSSSPTRSSTAGSRATRAASSPTTSSPTRVTSRPSRSTSRSSRTTP